MEFRKLEGVEVSRVLPPTHYDDEETRPTLVLFIRKGSLLYLIEELKAPKGWISPLQGPIPQGKTVVQAFHSLLLEMTSPPRPFRWGSLRYVGSTICTVSPGRVREVRCKRKLLHFFMVELAEDALIPNPEAVRRVVPVTSWDDFYRATEAVHLFRPEKGSAVLTALQRVPELGWTTTEVQRAA
jgi:hypothetical protein